MRLFMILSITAILTLASGSRLSAIKRRRESKWDIIHHEYHGPPAPLSKDGRVIDTPEVAEAKANHLAIHAETVADLAKKMAEANALEAKSLQQQAEAAAAAAPEATPIVAQEVQMTPELMAMLLAAAAEEQQQAQQEQQQQAEGAGEAGPESGAQAGGEAARGAGEAGSAAGGEASSGAGEGGAAAAAEGAKLEESKPVVENEIGNELDSGNPVYILQRTYEGPLAPLAEDGRVLDTPEVVKAKEAHLLAFERAAKLSTAKEEEPSANNLSANGESGSGGDKTESTGKSAEGGEGGAKEAAGGKAEAEAPSWFEVRKRLYVPPVHLVYRLDGPVGYKGPSAPIGNDGRVVDTEEVERAKNEHRKAWEHAEAIAKRHPPKPDDNAL